jgi:AcrR family transcriptional regulator
MSAAEALPLRRTQASRREDAARALLDAAAVLFSRRGIDQSSMADIGEVAGYSRGLANHHFGSKATLIEQLIARCQERFVGLLDRPAPGDCRKAIEDIAERYLSHFEQPIPDSRALLVMWGASFPSENPVTAILEADRRVRAEIERLVRAGQREGSISKAVDPGAFSLIFLGLIRGVSGVVLTNSGDLDAAALRKQLRALIDDALKPKGK